MTDNTSTVENSEEKIIPSPTPPPTYGMPTPMPIYMLFSNNTGNINKYDALFKKYLI